MKFIEFDRACQLFEDTNQFVHRYLPWLKDQLQLDQLPNIQLLAKPEDQTFGKYGDGKLYVVTGGRHPVDVLRTLAHELTHYKQDLDGKLNPDSGETGSEEENEANSNAGIIMRAFAKAHPEELGLDPKLKEDFTGRAKSGSRPGSLRRKAGLKKGETMRNSDLMRLHGRANEMKRSNNKATRERGVQLARQVQWYKNFHKTKSQAEGAVNEDAVADLKKDLKNPHSYDAIDHMMKAIAKKHKMTPKQLHDKFVNKTGDIPDNWIKQTTKEDISRRGFMRGAIGAGVAAATGGALAKTAKQPTELPMTGYYQVWIKPGDTIYSIARSTASDPHDIMKLNGFDNKTRLEKGQLVKIPEYGKNPEYPLKAQQAKAAAAPVAQPPVVPGKSIYADPTDAGVDRSRKTAEPVKSTDIPKSIAVNNPKSALNEPGFMDKLKDVAHRLGLEVNALIGIIGHETIRTFSPSIQAPDKITKDGQRVPGAVGLIQFTHGTAKDLGTSTEELKRMSGTQQLDYVYRFLKRSSRPGMDAGDLYMSIFIPAYVGRDPRTVIAKEGGGRLPGTGLNMDQIWRDNPEFGKHKHKSYFTIQDVKDTLANFMNVPR